MRAQDDVVELQQRISGRRRFLARHVQAGATDAPAGQCPDQRILVDQRAARHIDEIGAGLHLGEFGRAHGRAAVRVRGQVQRYEVGLLQGVAKVGDMTVSGGLDRVARDVGIGDHDGHVERGAAPRHLAADAAEPDDEHGLAPQFGQYAGVACVVPAGAGQPVHHHQLPGNRDHHPQGELRHGHRVGLADDRERYAAPGQCVDVDQVKSDSEARDHLQPGRLRDRVGVERCEPQQQAVDIGDPRLDIGDRRRAQHLVIDVGPRVEECVAGFVDRTFDQDIRHIISPARRFSGWSVSWVRAAFNPEFPDELSI